MRRFVPSSFVGVLLATALASSIAAGEKVKTTYVGDAVLPAASFLPPPRDAGRGFVVSGRFAAVPNRRVEEIASVEGKSFLDGRTTGIALPFVGQPVQGFFPASRPWHATAIAY